MKYPKKFTNKKIHLCVIVAARLLNTILGKRILAIYVLHSTVWIGTTYPRTPNPCTLEMKECRTVEWKNQRNIFKSDDGISARQVMNNTTSIHCAQNFFQRPVSIKVTLSMRPIPASDTFLSPRAGLYPFVCNHISIYANAKFCMFVCLIETATEQMMHKGNDRRYLVLFHFISLDIHPPLDLRQTSRTGSL